MSLMRTHPVKRAIGVSHTACKDEFRQNLLSHTAGVYSYFYNIFIYPYILYIYILGVVVVLLLIICQLIIYTR